MRILAQLIERINPITYTGSTLRVMVFLNTSHVLFVVCCILCDVNACKSRLFTVSNVCEAKVLHLHPMTGHS